MLVEYLFFLGSGNIGLNLGNQRRHGNERAPQRLGFQDAAQLLRLQWVHLRSVNARVLCRTRRLFFHPGGAAHHFRMQRVLPLGLVIGVAHDLIAHCSQLRKGGRWHHVDGNLNVLGAAAVAAAAVAGLVPLGMGGGTVSGSGL